jgi:alcohol dehydrogenase class IV
VNPVLLQQPTRIFFGQGCAAQSLDELVRLGRRRIFVVAGPRSAAAGAAVFESWRNAQLTVHVCDWVDREPDIALFQRVLAAAREFRPDAMVGFGGGSPLDVAKLVGALLHSAQRVEDAFGIGRLQGRGIDVVCIATTAGTGSEVSPNAILLDEGEKLKKGVVSPYLVPTAAILDPQLTVAVPPSVTAATGIDALVHCMEAYANKFAHPAVDVYALEGIRRIGSSIETAVKHGDDLAARSNVMLGALYGGLCLGPVNTAAVHALSYPLGGEFHVAHGVANSLLMPHVFQFNLAAAPQRYAEIATALGVADAGSPLATAEAGVRRLAELSVACGIPARLRDFGVAESDLPRLAREAMKVTRLLKNNPREVTVEAAEEIYRRAF